MTQFYNLVQELNMGGVWSRINRGLLHGFVVALPIESVGAGFKWAYTQGVGLGIWPLKTKLLTVSGGIGPGFLYVDPTQEAAEVFFYWSIPGTPIGTSH